MLGELVVPERLALDNSSNLFLGELYRKIAEEDFIQGERFLVFGNEPATDWFNYKDARSQKKYFDGHIISAVMSRRENLVMGIALVNGQRDSKSIPTNSFQFGIRKITPELEAYEGLNLLENVVHRKLPNHGTVGDIYINGNGNSGNLVVDCFTDRWAYGGRDVNRWEQEKLISEGGMAECIGIINRTMELA
jgi:hypothetical protein